MIKLDTTTTGAQPALETNTVARPLGVTTAKLPQLQSGVTPPGDSVIRVASATNVALPSSVQPSAIRSGATLGGGGKLENATPPQQSLTQELPGAQMASAADIIGTEDPSIFGSFAVTTNKAAAINVLSGNAPPGSVRRAAANTLLEMNKGARPGTFLVGSSQVIRELTPQFIQHALRFGLQTEDGKTIRVRSEAELRQVMGQMAGTRPEGPKLSSSARDWLRRDFAARQAAYVERMGLTPLDQNDPSSSVAQLSRPTNVSSAEQGVAEGTARQAEAGAMFDDGAALARQRGQRDALRQDAIEHARTGTNSTRGDS